MSSQELAYRLRKYIRRAAEDFLEMEFDESFFSTAPAFIETPDEQVTEFELRYSDRVMGPRRIVQIKVAVMEKL